MNAAPWLSKSRIQSGRQCKKRLWLELHTPEESQWTTAAEARLSEGTRFGDLARELLGGGALVTADHRQPNKALAETAALLARPPAEVPMLFEPAFAHERVRVRVDAFRRDGDYDTLIEVKSTTSVKGEHLWDCAIQTWVARGSGRNVRRVLLGHVNKQFVYQTAGDYQGLLDLVDITADVEALIPLVEDIVNDLKQVAIAPVPEVATGPGCLFPYGCPFLSYCRSAEPAGPEFPVDVLPWGGSVAQRLVEAGYRDLREVPEAELESPLHRRVAQVTRTGRPYVSPSLSKLLRDIPFPRAYLDFETISLVVPRWLGTRPFQQVPFQFSLHVELEDGTMKHEDFLDLTGSSPLAALVERLLDAMPSQGPVIVWNQSFEGARLRELAQAFPQHARRLSAIEARLLDLLPIYRWHYYHRDMRGSWSIKAVLPTIAADLDYKRLDVADGGAAQLAYLRACEPDTPEDERERLRAQLLAYCERDTAALARLANAFAAEPG